MVTAHPLMWENGFVQFERLFTFLSLQTLFESDRLTASTKGFSYFKRSGPGITNVLTHFFFFVSTQKKGHRL